MYRTNETSIVLFLVLALCTPSFSDDKGVDTLPNLTDNQSLVILNENLNRMDSRTRTLQDSIDAVLPIDLSLYGSSVKNVLPIQGGGTGAATVQGAMDNFTTVASSTTGDVWTSDGSHGGWGNIPIGLDLVSTTTVSSVNSTEAIPITQGKNYLIVWKAFNPNAADLLIRIGFNGTLWTGITSRSNNFAPTITTADTWDTTYQGDLINSARYAEGMLWLVSRTQTADSMAFWGQAVGTLNAGTFLMSKTEGIFVGTATSFLIHFFDAASNVGSGTIWLYEITQ